MRCRVCKRAAWTRCICLSCSWVASQFTPQGDCWHQEGSWKWGSWGPNGHGIAVPFWLLFCCSVRHHPTITVCKWTKNVWTFSSLHPLCPSPEIQFFKPSFKHLICISLLKDWLPQSVVKFEGCIKSMKWHVFCHEGKERNLHALCDDEVTLTASQDVDSKIKLAEGKNKSG